MGITELKNFINIVVISNLAQDKPNELVRASIIRAGMCEKFNGIFNLTLTEEELFTLGLFSLMDAILDCKMEEVLDQIKCRMLCLEKIKSLLKF